MNTMGYIATAMIMKALNYIYAPSQNDLIDTWKRSISVCLSVSPSVCHTCVSVTYLPNVWFDCRINSHKCAPM